MVRTPTASLVSRGPIEGVSRHVASLSERGSASRSPTNLDNVKSQKKRVRKRQIGSAAAVFAPKLETSPAHHSNRVLAELNSNWKVIEGPGQWVLQQRKGRPRCKNRGWLGRSYCATRAALLRSIREYCGAVDAASLSVIETLPETHLDFFIAVKLPPTLPRELRDGRGPKRGTGSVEQDLDAEG